MSSTNNFQVTKIFHLCIFQWLFGGLYITYHLLREPETTIYSSGDFPRYPKFLKHRNPGVPPAIAPRNQTHGEGRKRIVRSWWSCARLRGPKPRCQTTFACSKKETCIIYNYIIYSIYMTNDIFITYIIYISSEQDVLWSHIFISIVNI